jgi:hydrogenase maturation factor
MCTSRLHRVITNSQGGCAEVEDVDGAVHQVSCLALDGPAPRAGEWLVVHAGYAIDRVDGAEAGAVVDDLRQAAAALAAAGSAEAAP